MTFELNRRRFIQSASGTTATLVAAQAIPGVFAAQSARPETVNVALIGCGGIRIEDDVYVTTDGREDLTRPLIPGHRD